MAADYGSLSAGLRSSNGSPRVNSTRIIGRPIVSPWRGESMLLALVMTQGWRVSAGGVAAAVAAAPGEASSAPSGADDAGTVRPAPTTPFPGMVVEPGRP